MSGHASIQVGAVMRKVAAVLALVLGLGGVGCSACTETGDPIGGVADGAMPNMDAATSGDGGDDGGPTLGGDGALMGDDAGAPSGIGDPDMCGGGQCAATELCIDMSCTCRPGFTRVADECVDLSSDPGNCGSPGNVCPDGSVCADGGCHGGCPDPLQRCDGSCVDVGFSVLHCGECDRRCDRSEMCVSGRCREYAPAEGCTECPCESCSGDFQTCCLVSDAALPVCLDADGCPGG